MGVIAVALLLIAPALSSQKAPAASGHRGGPLKTNYTVIDAAANLQNGVRLQATNAPVPTPSAAPVASQTLKNPSFSGTDSWKLTRGATFDPTVTATPGSGSIKLPSQYSGVTSGPIEVKGGVLYFAGAQVRQDTWPRGNITVSIQEVTAAGDWIKNVPAETGIAPYVNGEFAASGLYFTVDERIRFIQIVFIRFGPQASEDPMWIDDVVLERSPSIDLPRSPKEGFDGAQTRIDALGNWSLRNPDGSWQDWFPFCAMINQQRQSVARLKSIAAQGFNCDAWNGESVDFLQNAKSAGLRSFYQLGQYTDDRSWAPGQVDLLAKKYAEVQRSPAADYLAAFYLDNENSTDDVARTKLVTDTVKAIDVVDGKRRRPIMQLMGSYGSLGLWSDAQGRPLTDAVGTYVPNVNSGGAGSAPGGQLFLETQKWQTQPTAYCQINDGIGVKFRAALFGCLAQGSRAVAYWGDGPVDKAFPSAYLEDQPWWLGLPSMIRDLKQMGPLLRKPTTTTWSLTTSGENQLVPVVVGRRDLDGIAHIILGNVSSEPQSRSFVVSNLPYAAAEVRDFFTNARVATVAPDGSFQLFIPAAGLYSGSMVLRLVPEGWVPPSSAKATIVRPTSTKPAGKPSPTKKPSKKKTSTKKVSASASTTKTSTTKAASNVTIVAAALPPQTKSTVASAIIAKDPSPESLCRSGVRLDAETARIPVGSVPVALANRAREWKQNGAPSALNWITNTSGKLEYRVRYIRAGSGDARRTMFAVPAGKAAVSKQFLLPSSRGEWATATVQLDVPPFVPVEISASFDILTDSGDIDLVDYVDICPV